MAKLSRCRAGLESFEQPSHHVNMLQAQLLRFVFCRDGKKRGRLGSMAKASKYRGADARVHSQPKTIHSRTSREMCVLSCRPLMFFFFFCAAVQCVIDSDKDDSNAPSHAVWNHLFASCGVQAARFSTCTAEHASGNTATARGSNIGLVNLPFAFCPSTHGSVQFALSV